MLIGRVTLMCPPLGSTFSSATTLLMLTGNDTRLFSQNWENESAQGFKNSNVEDQCTYRYKIYVEGWAWSVSEKYILACDSPTLYITPHFYTFFVRGMAPFEHFWPIRDTNKCKSLKFAEWGNNHTFKMEQKQSRRITDGLPTLFSNYPWLVAQNFEPEDNIGKGEDVVFYTVHDPMSQYYRCRIPELVGRRIRACFHGWIILSNHPHDVEWSLWNPLTSKFISLPPLNLEDGASDDILHCCLSSPPDDPGSILLLTRVSKPNVVLCRLDQGLRSWIEMSYSEQLTSITGGGGGGDGDGDGFLIAPTCCNGKVYAWAKVSFPYRVIQIDIAVKENNDLAISLLPFVDLPYEGTFGDRCALFLKVSGPEMSAVIVGVTDEKPIDVYLYKLDMNSMVWIKMKDLKDTVFFVDLAGDYSVSCSPAIASKFGGYIHFLHETGKVIYSYDVKDKTISLSSTHCLDLPPRSETRRISVWAMPEIRLQDDNGEAKCKVDPKEAEGKGYEMVVRSAKNIEVGLNEHKNEEHLLNIPFHVLEMIMEICVGIEYLNFRATCRLCRLAAPMIQWSNERVRLQTYSLVSPWLMVLDKDRGIISFTDPMFGDNKYLIRASPELFYDRILCSRHGWLLLFIHVECLVFFNPFTSDIRKLPQVSCSMNFSCCFSAPPTSPDCMVVGFSPSGPWNVYIHFVAGEPSWRKIKLDFGGGDPDCVFRFPTFCDRDVYALSNKGGLEVFKAIDDRENFSWEAVVDEDAAPRSGSAEHFQSKCDQHHLLVIVGEFGESVEVFKLNECTEEWEKVDSLGRHAIYVSDTSCVCMDAKTPEMENKIYFPRLNCENGKIVFYSMETRMYHTFNGRNVEQNKVRGLFGTKRLIYTQAWIEPTWS